MGVAADSPFSDARMHRAAFPQHTGDVREIKSQQETGASSRVTEAAAEAAVMRLPSRRRRDRVAQRMQPGPGGLCWPLMPAQLSPNEHLRLNEAQWGSLCCPPPGSFQLRAIRVHLPSSWLARKNTKPSTSGCSWQRCARSKRSNAAWTRHGSGDRLWFLWVTGDLCPG